MSWRRFFRRRKWDEERARELAYYLETETEENVARGMSREEARRAAHIKLGNATRIREEIYEMNSFGWLETLWRDLRFGARMLRKSPGFATVAVLTLALGIGANTAIFSLVDAVMLRSLPVWNPSQLIVLKWAAHNHFVSGEYSSNRDCVESEGAPGLSGCSFPLPIFEQLRSQNNAFSDMAAFAGPAPLDLSGNGPARVVFGEMVSGDYFSTLGVNAAIGRTLGPSDDSPSTSPSAVLSYAYWQSAFGGSRTVLGRTILLNKVPFTIVGVAEPSFTNLTPGKTQDLWLTIAMLPRLEISWGSRIESLTNWWLVIIGRLKPGVPLEQAQTAASLAFRNEVLYGPKPLAKAADDPEVVLTRAQDALIGMRGQIATILCLLTAAVGIILVIACANVAGLLLSRAATRQKEMAVRLALGASRTTLVRQLLTESVLLSVLGGVFGIVFAYWGVHAITGLMTGGSNQSFPYIIAPDWRVLSFVLGASILSGIFFGLAPALQSLHLDLTPALKENTSMLPGGVRRRWRIHLGNTLVVAQVALSVVVLAGAGLLVRTLENLRSINPGFDPHNMLLFGINTRHAGYKDAQVENLYRDLHEKFAAIPGVTSVSYASDTLLSGDLSGTTVGIEGLPKESDLPVDVLTVGPEFLRTMRIPLLEGRGFMPEDFRPASDKSEGGKAGNAKATRGAEQTSATASARLRVLVNEAFVRQYLEKRNPIGQRLVGGWEIIGVTGDTKYTDLRRAIHPMLYLPFTSGSAQFELRTAVDPKALIPTVRQIVKQADSNLPLVDIRTQTEQIDELLVRERLVARVSGFFGVLALVLACVGLYGLLSYEVSRRTREIGIRMALGADRRDLLRLVIGQGIVLAIVGAALGIGVALGVTRYLNSMLYGVHPDDPVTIVAVAALLVLVVLAASYVPARRAMRIDPMVAMRWE
ncbi:MAG TPA: ABC transporter permease [Candidatus Acidoferrales bacterium]|nr:ABC transporter permease [Candidatus Acidoferrales bacterium]